MSERRLAKRMRSSVLGGYAGCNEVTIWRIENGLINPRDTLKLGIAAALDCEVEDIWPMPRRAEVIAALDEVPV